MPPVAQARWKWKDLDPSNRHAGIRKVAAKADPTAAVRHFNDRLFDQVGRSLAASADFRSKAETEGWTLDSCRTLGAGVALPIITLKAGAMCAAILAGEPISATANSHGNSGNTRNDSTNHRANGGYDETEYVPRSSSPMGTGNTGDPCSTVEPDTGEHLRAVNSNAVPTDPIDPSVDLTPAAYAVSAFKRLSEIAEKDGPDISPLMDDLSARTINRLGGWPSFCGKATGQTLADLRKTFIAAYLEFVPNKLNGFYDNDHLPKVEALLGTQGVYRSEKF